MDVQLLLHSSLHLVHEAVGVQGNVGQAVERYSIISGSDVLEYLTTTVHRLQESDITAGAC